MNALAVVRCPYLLAGAGRSPVACPALALVVVPPPPLTGYITRCGHGHELPYLGHIPLLPERDT